jgi:hypothetical protein
LTASRLPCLLACHAITDKDAALADQLFEFYLSRLPINGPAAEAWIKGAIEFSQKRLAEASKEASINQVFDFSFVNQADSNMSPATAQRR